MYNIEKVIADESKKNPNAKYAYVVIMWKDEDNEEGIEKFALQNNEIDENDDEIFFYVNGVEELTKLTKKDNGEDFYITEFIRFDNN